MSTYVTACPALIFLFMVISVVTSMLLVPDQHFSLLLPGEGKNMRLALVNSTETHSIIVTDKQGIQHGKIEV